MLGTMKALRQKHPHDHLTLLTSRPFVQLAQQANVFDSVLIDTHPKFNPIEWYKLIKKIISCRFDLIYDLQISNRTKKRYYSLIRFFSKSIQWAFLDPIGFKRVAILNKKICSWGKKEKWNSIHFSFPKTDLSFLKGEEKFFYLLPHRYILIIPGCSLEHPYKRWPVDSYITLVKMFGQKKIPSVILGTSAESDIVQKIVSATPFAIDFLNKASLLDIPSLAQKSLCVIGNDTGPTHMASLSKAQTIYLFSEKTKKAALRMHNVKNFIGQNISDIKVENVFNYAMNIIKG